MARQDTDGVISFHAMAERIQLPHQSGGKLDGEELIIPMTTTNDHVPNQTGHLKGRLRFSRDDDEFSSSVDFLEKPSGFLPGSSKAESYRTTAEVQVFRFVILENLVHSTHVKTYGRVWDARADSRYPSNGTYRRSS